jgi:hypothetical protein
MAENNADVNVILTKAFTINSGVREFLFVKPLYG